MFKKILLPLSLLVPVVALALEIAPADFYTDVRPGSPEEAGINLLTREGIVQGYGDRRFGPTRLVNRAEFLKIAILASPDGYQLPEVSEGCFPDVRAEDWFAPYVCTAKAAGIVGGHADPSKPQHAWLFKPADPVNYDAALKMLVLLYRYEIPDVSGMDWAEPYYRAAKDHGTDLPVRITFDTPLTRAKAARLAGAFLAEHVGQLTEYRQAEAGQYDTPPATSSSSSSVSSFASSISSVSSSVSSSAKALFTVPAESRFLLTGKPSDSIASGVLRSNGETAKVSRAEVKLFQESRAIDYLELVTTDGTVIAKLPRRITTDLSDYKLIYETEVASEHQFTVPANTDFPVVLRAVVKSKDGGGFSEELVQVRTFNITIRGESTNETRNIPMTGPFPKHQTALGHITGVTRVSPATASLASGMGVTMGSFSFAGVVAPGSSLTLRQLIFTVLRTGTVTAQNWTVVNQGTNTSVSCSFNEGTMLVTCANLQNGFAMPADTPLRVEVRADLSVPDSVSSMETYLDLAGSPEVFGSIEWTDGTGIFRWVELEEPVARGTRLNS